MLEGPQACKYASGLIHLATSPLSLQLTRPRHGKRVHVVEDEAIVVRDEKLRQQLLNRDGITHHVCTFVACMQMQVHKDARVVLRFILPGAIEEEGAKQQQQKKQAGNSTQQEKKRLG